MTLTYTPALDYRYSAPLMNPSAASPTAPGNALNNSDIESVCSWITALANTDTRERALLELCKRRESVPDLAPLLWNSCGSIASLLLEICAIYPYINPPNLNAHQSNRVCNALALLQCLASHPDTRKDFLKANIPLYLYTFLNTNNPARPFEYLRLTSLGVIGALVKTDEPEVIPFLLGSEIIPLCLVIMESGTELSKTVATFIMQKLLVDNVGLAYICQTYERFVHVATVLEKMVIHLSREQSLRLLKHVIRCYLRLSDDTRARDALRTCLPVQLMDGTFNSLLEDDVSTKRWLSQLLRQVSLGRANSSYSSTNPTSNATSVSADQSALSGSAVSKAPPEIQTNSTTTATDSTASTTSVTATVTTTSQANTAENTPQQSGTNASVNSNGAA